MSFTWCKTHKRAPWWYEVSQFFTWRNELIRMSNLENIPALIFTLNWGIIWRGGGSHVMKIDTCYFSPSHPPTADYSFITAVPFPRGCIHTLHLSGVCPDGQRRLVGCWATPFRRPGWRDKTALSFLTAHIPAVSRRVMASFWPQRSPPGSLLDGISPLELIRAVTRVEKVKYVCPPPFAQPTRGHPEITAAAWMWKGD